MKISDIKAREVLDSRGNPTVEVDVILASEIVVQLLCHQEHQPDQKKP